MKNYSIYLGVDISKLTLDIVGINAENVIVKPSLEILNNIKEIRKYFKGVQSKFKNENILVCLENTGLYGYHLSSILTKLKIDYSVVPALEIHLSKGLSRGKSDKKDALMIAQYALSNKYKLKLSKLDEFDIEKLKTLNNQRDKISKALVSFNHTYENKNYLPKEITKISNKINESIINKLNKSLKEVEKEIAIIINANVELKTNFKLATSIPGVGTQTSVYLIIVTKNFTTFDDARKLACYAGVAPFPYQSGTSIKGKTKVHQFANKKLKSLLNMCALNAKKWDNQLNIYYTKKVDEGKNKMLVMNNIRNKLLHRIFAVIKRQTPYVNTHKFAA